MSRIVWLASYPKSGNTWLRFLLANFLTNGAAPLDINALEFGHIASDRGLFDQASGVESSELTDHEIEACRPDVYRHLAARSAETVYLKIHDAYVFTARGEPLLPAEATFGAVYVARNPLDVAVSCADHFACTIEESIRRLGEETRAMSGVRFGLRTQVRQRLLTWSGHASSWLDQSSIPVHLVRYEDLCCRPITTFASVVRFLGLAEDFDRIRRAVEFSCFENLQRQEKAHGFREGSPISPSNTPLFFGRGRPGGWREALTPAQVAQVVADHGWVMERLGYSTDNGHFGTQPFGAHR